MFKVGLIQTNSSAEWIANVEVVMSQIKRAAKESVDFVMLPETVHMMEPNLKRLTKKVYSEDKTPAIHAFKLAALKYNIWILVGSIVVRSKRGPKFVNRSLLIDSEGFIRARYDKAHLFDVKLLSGENYSESKIYKPGNKLVTATTPWGLLGMSICYDLRFPHLYRALAIRGSSFLCVPSAFTKTTGQSHWHVLLRARAIENGCFIFAPAQCGIHDGGRETYGHSLVVNPWGNIIAEADNKPSLLIADINTAEVEQAREQIPSLNQNYSFIDKNY